MPPRVPIEIRLQRNSEQRGDCRIWTGNCTPRGYPLVGKGGKGNGTMYAHRAAYELVKGKIPIGKEMHHTCGNTKCINAEHLEAVTPKEHRALHYKDVCSKGHKYTPENTYLRPDTGTRRCKICTAAWMRAYHLQRIGG